MNILLIEDDAALQMMTSRWLRRVYPHAVVTVAGSVAEALDLLGDGSFDLVVSDFDLGDATGADVVAWMHDHRPELVARLVFFSGNSAAGELGRPHAMKPCTMDEFRAVLAVVG